MHEASETSFSLISRFMDVGAVCGFLQTENERTMEVQEDELTVMRTSGLTLGISAAIK
jgi:hypothetical protein